LHLEDKSFKKLIDYRRIEKAKIYADKEFDLCVDGEMFIGKEFNIEIVKGALNFALPD
jgi:diacylglycerol kinase family enzyme